MSRLGKIALMFDAKFADEIRSVYCLFGRAWVPFDCHVMERKERMALYWFCRAGLIEQRRTGRAWAGNRSIRFEAVVSGAWINPEPVEMDLAALVRTGDAAAGGENNWGGGGEWGGQPEPPLPRPASPGSIPASPGAMPASPGPMPGVTHTEAPPSWGSRRQPILSKLRQLIRDWEYETIAAQFDPVVYARFLIEGERRRDEVYTCEWRLIYLLEKWTKPARVELAFLGPMEAWPVPSPDLGGGDAIVAPTAWGAERPGGGPVAARPAAGSVVGSGGESVGAVGLTGGKSARLQRRRLKRADRAAAIEKLQDCLQEHIRGQVDAHKSRSGSRPPALTQKLLGKLTGLSQATVSRCLRDKKAVMLKMLWLEQQKPEPSLYRRMRGKSGRPGGEDEQDSAEDASDE